MFYCPGKMSLNRQGVKMKIGIIGGTGMEQFFFSLIGAGSKLQKAKRFEHIYGDDIFYYALEIGSDIIYFIDRHHCFGDFSLPHQLLKTNAQQKYMYLLSQILGVKVVLATSAVGAIRNSVNVCVPQTGEIYCPVDAIDYTALPFTFANMVGVDSANFHRSMDDLFCSKIAEIVFNVSHGKIEHNGILGSTLPGPRFETRAEIEKYRKEGIDFLSMSTCFPEAVLAREAGMSYGLLACVSNLCPETGDPLKGDHVKRVMSDNMVRLSQVLLATIQHLSKTDCLRGCTCQKFTSVFSS